MYRKEDSGCRRKRNTGDTRTSTGESSGQNKFLPTCLTISYAPPSTPQSLLLAPLQAERLNHFCASSGGKTWALPAGVSGAQRNQSVVRIGLH